MTNHITHQALDQSETYCYSWWEDGTVTRSLLDRPTAHRDEHGYYVYGSLRINPHVPVIPPPTWNNVEFKSRIATKYAK